MSEKLENLYGLGEVTAQVRMLVPRQKGTEAWRTSSRVPAFESNGLIEAAIQ